MIDIWQVLTIGLSPAFIVLLFLFIYMLMHPEVAEKWSVNLHRLGAWASHKAELSYVSGDIQSRVNRFAKDMECEASGALPYEMQIEWVKEKSAEAFLRDGEIVVRMDYHKNQDRNLVRATMKYLSEGLMPEAKPYLDADLSLAADMTMARKIFAKEKRPVALNYFIRNVWEPKTKNGQVLKKYVEIMDRIDRMGFFTRVLLSGYMLLGLKVFGSAPSPSIEMESKKFLEFADTLATRGHGEEVELCFDGANIKVGVVLVAVLSTFDRLGPEPYLVRVDDYRAKGIDQVHLFGWGPNIPNTISIAEEVVARPYLVGMRDSTYSIVLPDGEIRECVGITLDIA